MSAPELQWEAFVGAAMAAGVSSDTIDVLEGEGFDDNASVLLKMTVKSLNALRLDPGEAEKTLQALEKFQPKKASSEAKGKKQAEEKKMDTAKKEAATKKAESKESKEEKNLAKPIADLVGKILNNISLSTKYILADVKEKKTLRETANTAAKQVMPDLSKLAQISNGLPKGYRSVRQGAAQLVPATQALFGLINAIGQSGQNPQGGVQRQLEMVMERFQGAVTYIKLAINGKLTDTSSSKLLMASAKGVEDRLLDIMNSTRTFIFNARGALAGEKKEWQDMCQSLWISIKGTLETLKHLGRMVLQDSSADQMTTSLTGAIASVKSVSTKAEKIDPIAFSSTSLARDIDNINTDLETLKRALSCCEAEKPLGPKSAISIRRKTRMSIAKSLFLASACANVCIALPELKKLSISVKAVEAPLDDVQNILLAAVKDPAGLSSHNALLRKAESLSKLMSTLVDEALKAVPAVKKVGNTDNLERRINEAKKCFVISASSSK